MRIEEADPIGHESERVPNVPMAILRRYVAYRAEGYQNKLACFLLRSYFSDTDLHVPKNGIFWDWSKGRGGPYTVSYEEMYTEAKTIREDWFQENGYTRSSTREKALDMQLRRLERQIQVAENKDDMSLLARLSTEYRKTMGEIASQVAAREAKEAEAGKSAREGLSDSEKFAKEAEKSKRAAQGSSTTPPN